MACASERLRSTGGSCVVIEQVACQLNSLLCVSKRGRDLDQRVARFIKIAKRPEPAGGSVFNRNT